MPLFGATRLGRLALARLATVLSHAVPRRYPYTNLTLTEMAGLVRFVDILGDETVREELDELTGRRQRVIIGVTHPSESSTKRAEVHADESGDLAPPRVLRVGQT